MRRTANLMDYDYYVVDMNEADVIAGPFTEFEETIKAFDATTHNDPDKPTILVVYDGYLYIPSYRTGEPHTSLRSMGQRKLEGKLMRQINELYSASKGNAAMSRNKSKEKAASMGVMDLREAIDSNVEEIKSEFMDDVLSTESDLQDAITERSNQILSSMEPRQLVELALDNVDFALGSPEMGPIGDGERALDYIMGNVYEFIKDGIQSEVDDNKDDWEDEKGEEASPKKRKKKSSSKTRTSAYAKRKSKRNSASARGGNKLARFSKLNKENADVEMTEDLDEDKIKRAWPDLTYKGFDLFDLYTDYAEKMANGFNDYAQEVYLGYLPFQDLFVVAFNVDETTENVLFFKIQEGPSGKGEVRGMGRAQEFGTDKGGGIRFYPKGYENLHKNYDVIDIRLD